MVFLIPDNLKYIKNYEKMKNNLYFTLIKSFNEEKLYFLKASKSLN